MGLQEVAHGADRVGLAFDQIHATVVVEIHRQSGPARGHELWQTDGAGVASAQRARVGAALGGEHQQRLELTAEEGLTLSRPGVRGREVQAQGGQGVQHAEVAHLAAIQCLDADDGDDDRRRHAMALLCALQRRAVVPPERQAAVDADGIDEALAVGPPVLRSRTRAGQHPARDLG
jgi:hypothetical protein